MMNFKVGDKVYIYRDATEKEKFELSEKHFHWLSRGVHKEGIVALVHHYDNDNDMVRVNQYSINFGNDNNICYPEEFVKSLRKHKLERLITDDK